MKSNKEIAEEERFKFRGIEAISEDCVYRGREIGWIEALEWALEDDDPEFKGFVRSIKQIKDKIEELRRKKS